MTVSTHEATATAGLTRRSARRREAGAAPRRRDIDGLRTLAIALVVLYHVWFGRVSGGVDVFLLVSAYLLTGSFVRNAAKVGWEFIGGFWVRRFARLLPPAAVTIAGILIFTLLVRPPSAWNEAWAQAWASLVYGQNWELASSAVDYYARAAAFPSPFQHFWSLSVQGQVFLLWPIIIALSLMVARRLSIDPLRILAAAFGFVFAASFVWSLVSTSSQQQVAYFDTWARLWEFALGSLLALVAPRLRVPARLAVILAWTGIVGLLSCGVLLDVEGAFPGWAALWPTLSAVCLLVAGGAATAPRPSTFLASAPMVGLGRIAYALYLVHWPVLIAYMVVSDSTDVGLFGGTAVIVISVVLAGLVHRYVERPSERWARTPVRRLKVIVASILIVVVPLGGWQAAEGARSALVGAESNPGARVLLPAGAVPASADAPTVPSGAGLGEEWVNLDGGCTGEYLARVADLREFCNERRAQTPSGRALVIGDSHAKQWMGAFVPITDESNWDVVALLRGACGIGLTETDDSCLDWQRDAIEYAKATQPDVVVLMGSRAEVDGPGEHTPEELASYVDALVAEGMEVLLIRDNPRFSFNMFECAERLGALADDCRVSKESALAADYPAAPLTVADMVHGLDLSSYLCPEDTCESVIGNVAVYLDDNHLTASYSRSMTEAMRLEFANMPAFPLP